MSLSLALLLSDRKLIECLCHHLSAELDSLQTQAVAAPGVDAGRGTPQGYLGVGLYDQSEVLLSKRPLLEGSSLPGLVCRTPSSCVLTHVTTPAEPGFSPTDAQPYRYRDWLWAQSVALRTRPGFDRASLAIPSYIRGNLRTWRPEELVFHLFLSFLHRTGTLDSLHWDRASTRRALASALSLVDTHFEMRVDEGTQRAPSFSILATNGDCLIALGVDRPLYYRRVDGLDPCPLCTDRKELGGEGGRTRGHPHLRAVLVADRLPDHPSEGTARWQEVPAGTILEIDAALGVEQGPLSER